MRFPFPHPLALLMGGIVLAAALTYVVPAGEFQRTLDPETNRTVVVGGTYRPVPATPVGVLGTLTAIPRGIIDAADVVALVFLVGGAFAVIDRTGALRRALVALVQGLGGRASVAIPICCLAFAAAGALENMQEEIIALVPVLVMFAGRLGTGGVTAVAMSLGAAAVGSAFSPVNPFQVVIAQQVADVAVFSGAPFRLVVMAIALAIWIWGVLKYTKGLTPRTEGQTLAYKGSDPLYMGSDPPTGGQISDPSVLTAARTGIIMALMVATFATFIVGLVWFGWGFNELAAVFLALGIVAGLVGGLGVSGTADAFVHGFRDMAFAAILIGFARGIYVVLSDGHVIDTIVNGLFTPLAQFPSAIAAIGMMAVQTAVHVLVPSVSGQAVLTMPILAPLSDLLQISRQVTVLAYQYGAGLCELLTPTNGALMAVLAAAGVRFEDWLRFVLPLWVLLMVVGGGAVLVALAIGLT